MFRSLMSSVTAVGAVVTSGAVLAVSGGIAAADPSGAGSPTIVPLSAVPKRCDFSDIAGIPPATKGTGYTVVSRAGSTVNVEVHVTDFGPDIWYGLRLVEEPRPGDHCGAGDPGVATGRLYTDDSGNGSATVQAPIMAGASGAWIAVEGPAGASQQLSADNHSSDYIARF
ncbi:MAG TPA: hypothetical protein VFB19_16925 [Mycobacterium sp.]|nr:hypothetical protein [Mycobacterium sp.]